MYESEAETALRAAREAGRLLLARFVIPGGPGGEEQKGDGSPVSEADREADRAIRKRIGTAFPADGLLTEEGADDPARLRASRVWIVDPLDGTREFLAGSPEFAVHIALAVDGQPVVGVVDHPAGGLTWLAIRGQGAVCLDAQGNRRPVGVAAGPSPFRLATSRSHRTRVLEAMIAHLSPTEQVLSGSCGLKAALVASGRADAYIALTSRLKEWDVAAPSLLVEEAGGRCTDLRGRELVFNRPDVAIDQGFLATGDIEHAGLLRRLEPVLAGVRWLRPLNGGELTSGRE